VPDIDNINHVGMAVRDLAASVARFEAMGFQLTPYSAHLGSWKPGGPIEPLGSGNRCVMFANTYLEVLGSADPLNIPPRIGNFLKRHQGAHIICFNSEALADLDQRLRGAGIETSGVLPLQRDVGTPDGLRTAKFERIQFAPADSPEGYIQAARNLTPEYVYQPRYIQHANGCVALSEAIVVADKLDHFAAKYGRYLAASPKRDDGAVRYRLPLGATMTLVDVRNAAAMMPGTLFPPIPGIAAVSFRTRALRALRERLVAHGFTVNEVRDRLLVPAEQASGVAVIFEE
jgi:catechol 2,3-dioxygenase-like lactoylglutathione lyase family enzyme